MRPGNKGRPSIERKSSEASSQQRQAVETLRSQKWKNQSIVGLAYVLSFVSALLEDESSDCCRVC